MQLLLPPKLITEARKYLDGLYISVLNGATNTFSVSCPEFERQCNQKLFGFQPRTRAHDFEQYSDTREKEILLSASSIDDKGFPSRLQPMKLAKPGTWGPDTWRFPTAVHQTKAKSPYKKRPLSTRQGFPTDVLDSVTCRFVILCVITLSVFFGLPDSGTPKGLIPGSAALHHSLPEYSPCFFNCYT